MCLCTGLPSSILSLWWCNRRLKNWLQISSPLRSPASCDPQWIIYFVIAGKTLDLSFFDNFGAQLQAPVVVFALPDVYFSVCNIKMPIPLISQEFYGTMQSGDLAHLMINLVIPTGCWPTLDALYISEYLFFFWYTAQNTWATEICLLINGKLVTYATFKPDNFHCILCLEFFDSSIFIVRHGRAQAM